MSGRLSKAGLEAAAAEEQHRKAIEEKDRTIDSLSRRLARASAKADRMVEAAYEGARDAAAALGMPKPIAMPARDRRRRGEEVALWHLTDWQGAKVTPSYDSDIMRNRVHTAAAKMLHLTELQRQHHPVRQAVIACGGDMVEGLFNFPTQPFEIDKTLFDQWVHVSNVLAEVVLLALGHYDRVKVVPEWGNHGRVGSKRDCVPRSDNVDRMVYDRARLLCGKQPRLEWQECPEDIQRLEIGEYRALVAHGDEAGRNGYVSPTTMIAHVNRWRAGAYKWEFRDVYLGHYHRHAEEPLADGWGCVYWTGSTESDNRYAREQMAASGEPSQRLHFIDPERGTVTAQYRVWCR